MDLGGCVAAANAIRRQVQEFAADPLPAWRIEVFRVCLVPEIPDDFVPQRVWAGDERLDDSRLFMRLSQSLRLLVSFPARSAKSMLAPRHVVAGLALTDWRLIPVVALLAWCRERSVLSECPLDARGNWPKSERVARLAVARPLDGLVFTAGGLAPLWPQAAFLAVQAQNLPELRGCFAAERAGAFSLHFDTASANVA